MPYITFTYEIHEEDQEYFIERLRAMMPYWIGKGFPFSLHRDVTRKTRFMQAFETDQSVEALSALIEDHDEARELFEEIKDSAGKIHIAVMETLIA